MLRRAEDVRVVLLEAAHAREAGERAAQLVAVQRAEVRQPQRQLAPRAAALLEHKAAGQGQYVIVLAVCFVPLLAG